MQYRGRVKGKEQINASVVAYLYYEQRLLQDERARRLDACLGDRPRGAASGAAETMGAVRAGLVDAMVADGETAVGCRGLSGAA